MALNSLQLANLTSGEDDQATQKAPGKPPAKAPTKPAPPSPPIDSLEGGDIELARNDDRFEKEIHAKYPKPSPGVQALIDALASVKRKK